MRKRIKTQGLLCVAKELCILQEMKNSQKDFKLCDLMSYEIQITWETIGGWVGQENNGSQEDIIVYLVSYEPMQEWQYKLRGSEDYGRHQDIELIKWAFIRKERGHEV